MKPKKQHTDRTSDESLFAEDIAHEEVEPIEDFLLDPYLDEALLDVYSWYGTVLPPFISSATFPRFAIRSIELAHQVAAEAPMYIDYKAPTAYTDGKGIYIPAIFMMEKLYSFFKIPEEHRAAAACLLINGCQLHEAAHIARTPIGFDKFVRQAKNEKAIEYLDKYKGFSTVINIIEDQYIEQWLRVVHPAFRVFVDGKNHILLGSDAINMALDYVEAKACNGEDLTIDDKLGLLGFAKTIELRHDPRLEFIDDLLQFTDAAQSEILNVAQRAKIAVDLWEHLMSQTSEEEQQSSEACQKPGEGETKGPIDKDMLMKMILDKMEVDGAFGSEDERAEAAALIEEAMKDAEESDDKEDGHKSDKPSDMFGDRPITKTDDKVRIGSDGFGSVPEIVTRSILQSDPSRHYGDDNAICSRDWQKFGVYLRYLRQEKAVFGIPDVKGSKVSKRDLYRIITDGHILVKRDHKQVKRGRPEVILLLDASGSMRGHNGVERDSLFLETVDAGFGMFVALMQSGISSAVYAHTSTPHGDLRPLLYNVAAFRMPVFGPLPVTTGNFAERFNRLAKIDCIENFDGFQIEKVSKEFTNNRGSKVIVVLSDGAPAAGGMYGGSSAREHTQRMIYQVRRKGIHVISVSLVESVVRTNDIIYGENYNLHGFGPELNPTLQSIAQALAMPPKV